MSDLLRLLYRPGQPHRGPPDAAAPRYPADRDDMKDYLATKLMKPLYRSEMEHQRHVRDTVEAMTWAECIWTEIEMMQGAKSYYISDYDPLRL